MNQFTGDDLDRMQRTQESAMQDLCVLMRYNDAKDTIGHRKPSWNDGPTSICGLDQTGGDEQRNNRRVAVHWDARCRLPLNTELDLRDRVRIIMRFGRPCSPIVYEIAGPPEIGPSGMVVSLMKVQPSV